MSGNETRSFLAVDLGASGGKCFAGAFSESGFEMTEIHRFDHEAVPFFIADRRGTVTERTYWDDTAIYAGILEGLRRFRRDAGARLDGVGVDTWGADGGLFSADGEMIGKLYGYRDHRLDDMVDRVKARIDARRVYEITGIHFQPFNVSNQLCWMVENRPELLAAGAFYLPAPSLFTFFLCGARVIDSAWASVTQLADARTRAWSREILDALDIPARILPAIVAPGTRVGRLHEALARRVGLNRAEVMAVASHDTACAFAAAPVAEAASSLIVSSGTWSLVGRLVPEPLTGDAAFAAGLSNEGGIGHTRLLRNCMGSWLVQELRRVWRDRDGREMDWEEMDALAEGAPPFAALVDPDDASFYNPPDMEGALTEYCRRTGQAPPADRGGLLRTVYEGLALAYRRVNERLAEVCGRPVSAVHIVGGGSRNDLLNRFVADALDLPVVAGPEEATAVGNLVTQAVGAGWLDGMDRAGTLIRASFPIREFRPSNAAAWAAAWERFKELP